MKPKFEEIDIDTSRVRNVKRCDLCGSLVDRFCSSLPDDNGIFKTKFFQCQTCGAIGDAKTGIMKKLNE